MSATEILQVASELQQMTELYRELAPKRVVEIGCWEGGTLQVWLEEARPEFVLAIDLVHRNADAYEQWRKPETTLALFRGRSQSHAAIETIRAGAPYDWIFIDGDHDELPVRLDVEVCLPLVRAGGALVMHDIAQGIHNSEPTGPEIVFAEIAAAGLNTRTFIDHETAAPWAHGVGVVQL